MKRIPGPIARTLLVASLLSAFACGESDEEAMDGAPGDDSAAADVDAGPNPLGEALEATPRASSCGGFGDGVTTRALRTADGAYCDAEVLYWSYQADTGRLWLRDSRVIENCSPWNRTAELRVADGLYSFIELQNSDDIPSACNCSFDYEIEAAGIASGTIHLQLMRSLHASDTPSYVFETDLELATGSGSVVIDATPETMWCSTGV